VKGVWLETLTWPEAKRRIDEDWPVVIPIGAISKEHGHHLPLNTDFLYARELANLVAAELPIIIAPVVCFGYYPAFVRYPGSQHIGADTFRALLHDIFGKFARDGVRRMAVINTGVSTEPVLRVAVRDFYEATGQRIHTADIRMLGRKSRALMRQKVGGHGDESETSVILAIAPDAVRMDLAAEDYGHSGAETDTVFYTPTIFDGDPSTGPDYSRSGVKGDPSLATAEKGQAVLADMASELIAGLRAVFPDISLR
jgi:creatinine amidohydrolase